MKDRKYTSLSFESKLEKNFMYCFWNRNRLSKVYYHVDPTDENSFFYV